MSRIVIISLAVLLVFILRTDAAKYGSDNRPRPIVYVMHLNASALDPEIDVDLQPYAVCPGSLLYVYDEDPSQSRNPDTGEYFNGTIRIYGCCPSGTVGCVGSLLGIVKACCPNDTICCVDDGGNFMGCVREYGQCCEGAICPEGYGCCENAITPADNITNISGSNTACCPLSLNSTGANDFASYCNVLNASEVNNEFDTTSYNGCLVSNMITLPFCPQAFPADANCSTNPLDANFCNNQTVRCKTINECVYLTDTIQLQPGNISSIVNVSTPIGCCPVGTEACISGEGTQLFGCANTTAGEACCGGEICPLYSKCCNTTSLQFRVVYDTIYNEYVTIEVNTTVPLGCCPNELQCCQRNLMNLDERLNLYDFFFCGKSLDGTDCAVDMHREAWWYELFLAQNDGLV
jgi:hypothetical protein